MSDRKTPTRRDFLSRAPLAATALGSVATASGKAIKSMKPSVPARSASRVVGANDRINVASIGVGGMGGSHLRAFVNQSETRKDIQVVAVSDVYKLRKDKARDAARLTGKDVHHDYRELLARNDVDAVVIAVPDHWHGQIALDALAAGKDVYLQKPMTYTIEEARLVAEATAKYNRVLQVGSQHLSTPHNRKARDLVEAGAIGQVIWAQGTSSRNSINGEWNYYHVDAEGGPETIDWSRWLGTAPKRPFSADRYFRWRKYWDYSGGIATDLFYHTLGPLAFITGAEFPTSVTAAGGIYMQKDREVPDAYATQIEYPNLYISLAGSMLNAAGGKFHGSAIYGHNGTIWFSPGKVIVSKEVLIGSSLGKKPPAPPDQVYEIEDPADAHGVHTDNFFSCMRTRKTPNFPADLGYRVMVAIRLGVDAYREGKTKFFDPKTQRVIEKLPPRPAYEGDGKNYPSSTE